MSGLGSGSFSSLRICTDGDLDPQSGTSGPDPKAASYNDAVLEQNTCSEVCRSEFSLSLCDFTWH